MIWAFMQCNKFSTGRVGFLCRPISFQCRAKRSRPQRWRDAVAELADLQADYATWLEALPDSLRDSGHGRCVAGDLYFDLTELEAALEPPRGFGRD